MRPALLQLAGLTGPTLETKVCKCIMRRVMHDVFLLDMDTSQSFLQITPNRCRLLMLRAIGEWLWYSGSFIRYA